MSLVGIMYLRQRELGGVVDGTGGPPHVLLPGVRAYARNHNGWLVDSTGGQTTDSLLLASLCNK